MSTRYRTGYVTAVFLAVLAGPFLAENFAGTKTSIPGAHRMSIPMKTVCIGRFLIDLPVGTEYQFRGAFIDGFDIFVGREDEQAFDTRLKARIDKLANPDPYQGSLYKPLELQRPFKIGQFTGTVLVAERHTSYSIKNGAKIWSTTVRLEAYARANGYSVDIVTEIAHPEEADRPIRILEQLTLNPEHKVPDEPGFCIGDAYLREPLPADFGERVTLLAGLKSHPDLTVMFSSVVGAKDPPEDLLTRTRNSRNRFSLTDQLRIHSLGEGVREINGLQGQQTLTRYREHNRTVSYAMAWATKALAGDVFRPALFLEMATGVNPQSGGPPVESSFTQEEALQIWNQISSSVRLRKNVAPSPSQPTQDIGTRSTAGNTCPRSGLWECSEDGGTFPIAGGRRRHFKEGDIFPQADVLAPQTLWEKVKGHQNTFQSKYPTVWRLVQLDSKENT